MSNPRAIERASLGNLVKLTEGGQGSIYQTSVNISDVGFAIYKEYKQNILPTLDDTQLRCAIEFFQRFTRDEARGFLSIAAWPVQLVRSSGRTTGFLMPKIPSKFMTPFIPPSGQQKIVTAEFQHLLNSDKWLGSRGIAISDHARYKLLYKVAEKISYLHGLGIAIGDLSPANMLFSVSEPIDCYFIDCDAMSLHGASALPQMETPEWEIGKVSSELLATPKTDAYKFGLLALRLLTRSQSTRDATDLPRSVPQDIRNLIAHSLSGRPSDRPLLEAWIPPLGNAAAKSSRSIPSVSQSQGSSSGLTQFPTGGYGLPPAIRTPLLPLRPGPAPTPPIPVPPAPIQPPAPSVNWRAVWAWGTLAIAILIVIIVIATHGSSPGPATTAGQPGSTPAAAGPASSATSSSSGQSNAWSSGQQVDNSNNSFTAMSCPTTSFCMAVDGGGNAYSYSNGSWSSGQQIDTTGNGLMSVSCPTSSFCVATDSGADAYIYNGGSWSSSPLVGADGGPANLKSVSCPTAGVCFAVGSWNAYTYSNGAWATGQIVQEQNWFTSISCPTTSFCVAVDNGGNVYSYSNGSWSSPQQLDSSSGLISVSCATTSFCAAIDSSNDAYIDVNGTWSNASLSSADGTANLTWVSCPTSGYCLATGDNDVYIYSNSSWATGYEVQDNNNFASVSCPTTSFCMAVDGGGEAYSYSGG